MYWIPATRWRPVHFQNQIQFCVALWYDGRSSLAFIHGGTNATTYVEHYKLHFIHIYVNSPNIILYMITYIVIVSDAWEIIQLSVLILMKLRKYRVIERLTYIQIINTLGVSEGQNHNGRSTVIPLTTLVTFRKSVSTTIGNIFCYCRMIFNF